MRKSYILPVIAAILLTLVVIKLIHNQRKEKKKLTQAVGMLVQAECYLARDTVIDFPARVVGELRANERVDMVSELSCRLTAIRFLEGSRVSKGDILFELDDSDWRAALKKVEAKLELARETEKRNNRLLSSGGTSQQFVDETASNRKVLEAEAESLQVILKKARIRAPFSGVVGIRNVSEGAYVNPGTVLTTIEDLSRLKIDFSVPESIANSVKRGDRLSFSLEGVPGEHPAIVEAVDASVSEATGNLRVLALVNQPSPLLKAGMAVSISLEVRSAAPCLYIPTQALIPTPGGYKVYVMEGGIARFRPVKAGLRTEKMVEITEGLKAGDSLLVTGFMKVRPDMRVQIIKTW